MSEVYNIIEVANTHGGDTGYIKRLLEDFKEIKGVGIKFQAFKHDQIASPDFSFYHVYQELYFTPEQWSELFDLAIASGKEIWLDIFDSYGVDILKKNFTRIAGIKLQASVLYNQEVLTALAFLDLSAIRIIINVSGYDVREIESIAQNFKQTFSPSELIIQVGFQSYPTSVSDSGLTKIVELKKVFPDSRFSIADHTANELTDALYLPVVAVFLGFRVIEKHIMLKESTKYDFQSSLTIDKYKQYLVSLESFTEALHMPFIPVKEREYLRKTIQIPFLNKDKKESSLIVTKDDLDFRRTDKVGLNYVDLQSSLSEFMVLRDALHKGDVIRKENLRKARIGTIIACRMKSSRLPKKATAKVFKDLSSVEICIKNALRFSNVDSVTLATSTVEEDAVLSDYTYHKDVRFYRGHPEDVIERYLEVAEAQKLDVIVRVTADNMFISDEILEILLKSHFESGADYTAAKRAAIGTNIEVINVTALKKVKEHFPTANYSEYMTWYFQNNPDHFNLNFVELPEKLVRDYRLTLDYPEDMEMFQKLFEKMGKGVDFTLTDVFETLDKNPDIAAINAGCSVKYQTDTTLIETLNKSTKMK